jgi:hypothetical protein
MFTIRPSISSASSSSSSRTRSKTSARGDRILLLEKMRQKSFFGVGPYSTVKETQLRLTLPTYLKLKHIPYPIDTNKHQVSGLIVIFVQEFNQHVESTGTDKHLKRER